MYIIIIHLLLYIIILFLLFYILFFFFFLSFTKFLPHNYFPSSLKLSQEEKKEKKEKKKKKGREEKESIREIQGIGVAGNDCHPNGLGRFSMILFVVVSGFVVGDPFVIYKASGIMKTVQFLDARGIYTWLYFHKGKNIQLFDYYEVRVNNVMRLLVMLIWLDNGKEKPTFTIVIIM